MATVDYSQSGANNTSDSASRHPRSWPHLVIPFRQTVTVATTDIDNSADRSLLFQFPTSAEVGECFLDLASVTVVAADLDSGGTPALVMDFGIGDSDGTIDTELIANSTIGQDSGRDNVDPADIDSNGLFLDVTGKYFIMGCSTAAATAAAGTIQVDGYYTCDLAATTSSA